MCRDAIVRQFKPVDLKSCVHLLQAQRDKAEAKLQAERRKFEVKNTALVQKQSKEMANKALEVQRLQEQAQVAGWNEKAARALAARVSGKLLLEKRCTVQPLWLFEIVDPDMREV